MATKRRKGVSTKRSISAPLSLWDKTERMLRSQMPPVPISRHLQELMARDLQSRGLLNGMEVAR